MIFGVMIYRGKVFVNTVEKSGRTDGCRFGQATGK